MSVNGPLGATRSGAIELGRSALRAREATARSRLGLLALCGLLASGILICISAAHTESLLPETVRLSVPPLLAGPFGGADINLGIAGLIVVLAAMFASYVLIVREADRLSARLVLMAIAALHALVVLAPPLLSTDVFSYQAYARMGDIYGINAYLHGPHAIMPDPVYAFIDAKWVMTPTVYGPVFTILSYAFASMSIAASAFAYKAIAAAASLVVVTLVWNAARLRGVNPIKAAALVGLNPLIVIYGVGGGHNDLLMLAILVAGISLVLQRRPRAAGGSIALAAGIKLTAGMLLPFAVAGSAGPLSRSRRRDILIGASVVAAVVAALGFGVFGSGPLHLPGTLEKVQSEGDWKSIPGFIGTRLGLGAVGHVTGLILAAAFAAIFCWLVRRVWRGEMDWIDGSAWASAALLVTASSLLPWYVAWLMPLAALASDRRLVKVALVLTAVVQAIQMLGYIPHGSSLLGL